MIAADTAAFRAALPMGGRLIGLDVGTRTIGTALCDAGWTIASANATIRRTKFAKDLEALTRLIAAQQVKGVVVGLPLNLDGSDSPRTQSVRAFARNLAALTELPITFWDERLSTVAAERALLAADTSRRRRAEVIDHVAAGYILQGFLDRLRHLGGPS